MIYTLLRIFLNSGNFSTNIYLFKVNTRNTRKRCEIYSELTIKNDQLTINTRTTSSIPPENASGNLWFSDVFRRYRRRCSDVFIVNFEHISHHSSVSIVDFEQVNVSWVSTNTNPNRHWLLLNVLI